MITDKQLEANQENAKLGGVKTDAGKAVSKYNAMRHGILTKAVTDDEVAEANQIYSQLVNDYSPKTLAEELLIETMAIAYTRRQRAVKAEREYLMAELNPLVTETHWVTKPAVDDPHGYEFLYGKQETTIVEQGFHATYTLEQIDIIVKTHSRYINTCERQFYRALHELQRIHALQKGQKLSSITMDVISESNTDD